MISPISSGAPSQQPADNQSKIERLLTTMENVRKELRELNKKLEEERDPKVRRELAYRIQSLEDTMENLRQQLILLTQLENSRKKNQHPTLADSLRQETAQPPVATQDTAANTDTQGDDGSADIYYPPDSN